MNRIVYDRAFDALVCLLDELRADSEDDPKKWDEEYVEHAIDDALDRMICAGPFTIDDERRVSYEVVRARAARFLDEDVPLHPVAVEPAAMQVWRGKGEATDYEIRLVEVAGDRVIFQRILVPLRGPGAPSLGEAFSGELAGCSLPQLRVAYEYAREATEDDLAP